MLPVGVGQHLVGVNLPEGVLIHIAAVIQLEIAGKAVIGAVGAPDAVQGVQLALQISLILLGESVALAFGGVDQGGDLGQVVNGLIQQVVPPGLTAFLVIDLFGRVHAVIKGGSAHHGIVVGGVERCLVIILDHSGAIVLSVNGDSGGALLEEAAVPDQQGNGQHHDHAAGDAVQHVLAAVLVLLAVIPALNIGGVRPGFLFSGCTHS